MTSRLLISFTYLIISTITLKCVNVNRNTLPVAIADTTIRQGEIIVNYNLKTDTLSKPAILSSSTLMISDSMLSLDEFRLLRKSIEKYDSLNFMNCTNGGAYRDKLIPIVHYDYIDNILSFDAYISGANGRFFFGKIDMDNDNNLIVEKGPDKVYPHYFRSPVERRISLKIYIPSSITFINIFYRCP